MSNPTASLLIIGNEILSGRTIDANLSYIARVLGTAGIRMTEARIVPDIEARIIEAVRALAASTTYVFTTGGIGPTHDDITAASIARAFDVPLVRNAEAERRLRAYYPPEKVNDARLRMADIPQGASLIDNPVSTAPGFVLRNVHVLPGVPRIMQPMLDLLVPTLTGGKPLRSRTVVCDEAEGVLADGLRQLQATHGSVEIGSYPGQRDGRPETSIVFRGTDPRAIEAAVLAFADLARQIGFAAEDQGLAPL
ncbi:molybdenum cofactor synthesis domain-containing protein [Arboricoccus pini]|uniref:Molybdenum cofactor synthesis domain-containing protein n=1 Tax=Arboricoccus pini TaxID=1963835 RepID=A0A212QPA0_9PROT|nr:molybdopterin-binding protein [Arboricoccus pini]SNB61276.1 molybdenum cofactor synthesis domain-containing protein [Arboricoccus pini]